MDTEFSTNNTIQQRKVYSLRTTQIQQPKPDSVGTSKFDSKNLLHYGQPNLAAKAYFVAENTILQRTPVSWRTTKFSGEHLIGCGQHNFSTEHLIRCGKHQFDNEHLIHYEQHKFNSESLLHIGQQNSVAKTLFIADNIILHRTHDSLRITQIQH